MGIQRFDCSRVPPAEAVRAALYRISESAPFKASPRLAAFLRYVVNAALEGRAGSIKAYSVAIDALARPDSFDPNSDAIVRVEARRLRRALAQYYENGGAEDAVVINIPLGGYAPDFRWRGANEADVAGEVAGAQGALREPQSSATRDGTIFDPERFLGEAGEGRKVLKYRAHRVVYARGDIADAVYYMQSGAAKLCYSAGNGSEVELSILGPGDIFGDCCLSGQMFRPATVTTLSECVVTRAEKDIVLRTVREEPTFPNYLIRELIDRHVRSCADIADRLVNSNATGEVDSSPQAADSGV